ncbi:hypothetical protein ACJ41O_008769 [Fusarium nematophilum]
MPVTLVGKTPDHLIDDQVAGVSLATMAAATALVAKSGHGMPPPWGAGGQNAAYGKAITIRGGLSSVGQYAIQLAKISGFERIITNSSSAHFAGLRSLRAAIVLDRSTAASEDYAMAVGGL